MSVRPDGVGGSIDRICVYGLWHLGCVTAACLADGGFTVVGLDGDSGVVRGLSEGAPPLFEPGLAELIRSGVSSRRLSFTTDSTAAVEGANLVWVTFDTPVDEEDRADVDAVKTRIAEILPLLEHGAIVLISSQLPVGTVRELAKLCDALTSERRIHFACAPENLRLGRAIEAFKHPDRMVVGVDDGPDRLAVAAKIEDIFAKFCSNIIWMSIESAEMVKHSLNAFLAVSVTFINEVATVCERVGADAGDVEMALRAERRIGQGAYIRPGGAFAGGTLARDVRFLTETGAGLALELPLLHGVAASNDLHRLWPERRLAQHFGGLAGRAITILGLSYKPGTDAIRRSAAVELCHRLTREGARVTAFDPAVRQLPDDLVPGLTLAPDLETALIGAEALVIATDWPDFAGLSADRLAGLMAASPLVLDPNRLLPPSIGADARLHYLTVGKASWNTRC